ncbi:MAG: hypothetical protein JSW05_04590 [Candidatus Thorarchaeota archaeon]|nr:MAG: hypothetical protein JSW05_04590 [Candidatus Thorarchaeota archaeon]
MLRVLILIFIAIVVAAAIVDRKQKYSDDKDVKVRPSPGVRAAIGRTTPSIRPDGYLHSSFSFPSDEETNDWKSAPNAHMNLRLVDLHLPSFCSLSKIY